MFPTLYVIPALFGLPALGTPSGTTVDVSFLTAMLGVGIATVLVRALRRHGVTPQPTRTSHPVGQAGRPLPTLRPAA